MAMDDQHPQSIDQNNWRIESQRQTFSKNYKGILRPSQIPNNTGGVSGSGSLSAYLLLILLPMLIGGALLVKRLLQIEPYSFDRWEAPPISSPQKDKD